MRRWGSKAVATGEAQGLLELREELKVSKASEALAQEELQGLREEHARLKEVEARSVGSYRLGCWL